MFSSKLFLIPCLLSLFLSNCSKREPEPTLTSAGDWILTNAQVYIKRWGNYPLERYDLFTDKFNYNCLDLTGNDILLDQIYRDSTRWTLAANGDFMLDSAKTYETQNSATFIRLFPTEDGSARVFILDDLSKNHIRWRTSEREQGLVFKGVRDNYTYFTKLYFKRKGTNDPYNLRADLESSVYSGTLSPGISPTNALKGQVWELYKYKKEGLNAYQTVMDTLFFSTKRLYHINTLRVNQDLNYALFDMESHYTLTLDHTRLGASIHCANIPKTQLDGGDIRDAKFLDLSIGGGGYYFVSLRRIN